MATEDRHGVEMAGLKKSTDPAVKRMGGEIARHLQCTLARQPKSASVRDFFMATSLATRDRIIEGLLETEDRYTSTSAKRLYYLSMEFLIGRSLSNNLHNLGIFDVCRDALIDMGADLDEICESEHDAALGNGGLGRLAACFLDSLATLGMPGFGYGLNYDYGLFRQEIDNGRQRELPDTWFNDETPWLIARHEEAALIPVYGRVEPWQDREGNFNPMWLEWNILVGLPHDMPIVGYGGRTVNTLRLFSARASDDFDIQIFNDGDYFKAVEQKMYSENISKVLYPTDSFSAGKELRLVQEYFLVACALRDVVRKFRRESSDFLRFHEKVAMQLNDTHPALMVAELMRFLVDEESLPWEKAWDVTVKTLGYTNHTLLSEALEKWPVPLLEYVLPRHLQIIYEINHRFLQNVGDVFPDDFALPQRMSIIEESNPKQVRMAYLSIVGSHSVNGVAALHSELVKSNLVPDFYRVFPERFNNKTNGVTQRRWLLGANPDLAALINSAIGDSWITDLSTLTRLERLADDSGFQDDFQKVKLANKRRLAEAALKTPRIQLNPASLFDVQVKRMHEYKRQLLNVMHVVHRYLSIIEDDVTPAVPRTVIFAGKAAPGYWNAKLIIKLINNVAEVVNNDPRVGEALKVVFLPDYRVSLAEKIIPSADLSEQISTAGMEASGTGNMKFMMNGALTIGTLDGANIEIMEEAGIDNIYIFGLKSDEVEDHRRNHSYDPWSIYRTNDRVRRVMDAIRGNLFTPDESGIFTEVFDRVMNSGDFYFHLADFDSYLDAQTRADRDYLDRPLWSHKAILNVARSGKFSSDRTIRQYASEIWGIKSH